MRPSRYPIYIHNRFKREQKKFSYFFCLCLVLLFFLVFVLVKVDGAESEGVCLTIRLR